MFKTWKVCNWGRVLRCWTLQTGFSYLAVAHSWQLHFQTLIFQDSKISRATWVTEFLLEVWMSVSVPNYQQSLALSSSHTLKSHPNKELDGGRQTEPPTVVRVNMLCEAVFVCPLRKAAGSSQWLVQSISHCQDTSFVHCCLTVIISFVVKPLGGYSCVLLCFQDSWCWIPWFSLVQWILTGWWIYHAGSTTKELRAGNAFSLFSNVNGLIELSSSVSSSLLMGKACGTRNDVLSRPITVLNIHARPA